MLVDLPGDDIGFTASPRGALLDFDRLSPGGSTQGTFAVRNDAPNSGKLSIALRDVHDDDNGCRPSEALVDHGCGDGQGELGSQTVLTVAASDNVGGPFRAVWTGSPRSLAQTRATVRTLPASATTWLRLTIALPASSGDETQTDELHFGVVLTLTGEFGRVSTVIEQPPAGLGGLPFGRLPVTGAPLVAIMVLGGGLIVAGGGVLGPFRRRRARGATRWTN
jgi:LPXTG-motif cell wall-anchored protein